MLAHISLARPMAAVATFLPFFQDLNNGEARALPRELLGGSPGVPPAIWDRGKMMPLWV